MANLRAFVWLVKMNLLLQWRDRQAMFWATAFPLMLMLLLGAAFGSIGNVEFKVAVVDEDHSEGSGELSAALSDVEVFDVGHPPTLQAALDRVRSGDLDLVVVIPAGYGAALDRYAAAAANNTSASVPPVAVRLFLNDAQIDRAVPAANIVGDVVGAINLQVTHGTQFIQVRREQVEGSQLDFFDFLAPGIVAMSIMNSAIFGFSLFMVNAREKGILKRLKATPVSPAQVLGARIVLGLVISAMQAVIIMSVALLVFGVTVVGSLVLVGLVTLIGALTFLSLGFLISSLSRSVDSAEAFTNAIGMPMIFLGDVFIPVALLPAVVQSISRFMPLTYFAQALRTVMVEGGGLADVAAPLGILSVLGVAIFAAAVKTFRWD